MRNILKNSSGFSLVQVLVAVALTGMVALALMQLQDNTTKTQTKINFTQDLNSLTNQIQTELSNRENCSATIENKVLNETFSVIKKGKYDTATNKIVADGLLFQSDKTFGSTGLKIDRFQLIMNTNLNREVIRAFFKTDKDLKMFGSSTINKDFVITAEKNALGKYVSCFSDQGNLVQQACDSIGGVWDEANTKCNIDKVLPECVILKHDSQLDPGLPPTCKDYYSLKKYEFDIPKGGWSRKCTQRMKSNSPVYFPGFLTIPASNGCTYDLLQNKYSSNCYQTFELSCYCMAPNCSCGNTVPENYTNLDIQPNCVDVNTAGTIKIIECCRP